MREFAQAGVELIGAPAPDGNAAGRRGAAAALDAAACAGGDRARATADL
jgi:ATP phosphoribosyltransferase regulatory subunit HisZ